MYNIYTAIDKKKTKKTVKPLFLLQRYNFFLEKSSCACSDKEKKGEQVRPRDLNLRRLSPFIIVLK
jgi:hypothetical protein